MTEAETIARWVNPGARVLDLGCGDGSLLKQLWQTRQAPGYGVEIDDAKVDRLPAQRRQRAAA